MYIDSVKANFEFRYQFVLYVDRSVDYSPLTRLLKCTYIFLKQVYHMKTENDIFLGKAKLYRNTLSLTFAVNLVTGF